MQIQPQVGGVPATYGIIDYGETLYGEQASAARQSTVLNEFVIEPFSATSLSYDSIGVAWTKPLAASDGTAERWRLISNRYGYPVDENDGNILIDGPDWLGTFYLDTAVIPGSYHYYGIYAQINPGSTYATQNGNGNRWVRVGVTGCLAVGQKTKANWLLTHLPAYFTDYLGGALSQDAAGNQYLAQFMEVLGFGLDYVQGQYDTQFQHLNDPMHIPVDDLVNLAAQMGMPYDPFISIYLMRKAVANWAHVATERGTTLGIRNQIELLTGFNVDLTLSNNQLLEDDQSWFPHPSYPSWNGWTSYHAGEVVQWSNGTTTWLYQSIAGNNVGNTPAAGATNAYWTWMENWIEPSGVLNNANTGGVNTWEVVYPAQTNGTGPAGSLYESVGNANPANANLLTANTLGLKNKLATSQDMYLRSISRSTADLATTETVPWSPDQGQVINDGIPVPFTLPNQAWSPTVRYGTGAIVTYQGQPFQALRASTGAQPVPGRTATNEWQPLSPDQRLRLWVNAKTTTWGTPVGVTPYVEWFDQWGNFISRVAARTPVAGTPGRPDQLAYDSFVLNPGALTTGRTLDNMYANNWVMVQGGFTVAQYAGGVAYQTTSGTRSVAGVSGPVNGQVGVTLVTFATGGQNQGAYFRWVTTNQYWKATPTALIEMVSGAASLTVPYSTAANPGDRLVVKMNGTAITVLLNGTQVATATDSYYTSPGYTSVSHGIIVE